MPRYLELGAWACWVPRSGDGNPAATGPAKIWFSGLVDTAEIRTPAKQSSVWGNEHGNKHLDDLNKSSQTRLNILNILNGTS